MRVSHVDKTQLDRIEAKLDALIKALADEGIEPQGMSLDGLSLGGERDESQPL